MLEVENIYLDTLSRCSLECGRLKTDSNTGQKEADKIAGNLDGKRSGKVNGTTSSDSTNSTRVEATRLAGKSQRMHYS